MTEPSRSAYRSAVAAASGAPALAEALAQERQRQRDANHRNPQGLRSCRLLSDATDLVLQRLLALALPPDPESREAVRRKICIVATGGYGRRELCPCSDIDVSFVVSEEEDASLDAAVRGIFMDLMEVFTQRLGLKVGYAYRTHADAATLDHQTQTALLDTRVVAGSHPLGHQFAVEVARHVWPAAFVRQKIAERRLQCERLGGTIYRIEPELREGPGGLRDIHLAEWLAAVSFPTCRGDVWRQLQRLGVVTRRDAQQVAAAREFLLSLRNWMHWQTGRPTNVLVRERQEHLAEALGFEDQDASAVELFMEQYYLHAEHAARVSGFVADRCLAERLSLTDELACTGADLQAAYPWLRVDTPRFLIDLGHHFQQFGLAPGYELRRMIAQQLESCADLGTDSEAADGFVLLLKTPPGPPLPRAILGGYSAPRTRFREADRLVVYETLALLAELGILQAMVPEMGRAYRRVPFDMVHLHTVGFHTLETVRALAELRLANDEAMVEFRRVWTEVEAPEVLYLAGLLHDVGKVAIGGTGAPGHADVGARMAREICARLRLDAAATSMVSLLVEHHLLMSETAQLRDLTLDKTIHDFVAVVDNRPFLGMLLLLTCADMQATGVMTPMKLRFLLSLYYRAEALLAPGAQALSGPENAERERRFRRRVSRELAAENLTPEQIAAHTGGTPVAYLLNTSPSQIATHIRMVESLLHQQDLAGVIEFDDESGSSVTTIHLCTTERPLPGLLSLVSGVLYAHDVRVHGAQVFTRSSAPPIVLDTLWVDHHGLPLPHPKRQEIEADLLAVLAGAAETDVIARRRKTLPSPVAPRRVAFNNDAAEHHTIMEIDCEDQPALLYRTTRAMARLHWNIHSARITTVANRARDAFYLTDSEGGRLSDSEPALVEAFLREFSL